MNEQELFWQGEFGDEYTERNQGGNLLASNIALFAKILQRTEGIKSVLEFGAGSGLNLRAIKVLLPDVYLCGVEINQKAVQELGKVAVGINSSILEWDTFKMFVDLTLSKGLLIHLAPEDLLAAYEALYICSTKYICLVEYYSPKPLEIEYRGYKNKLFKRDFAGEMLDIYPDLQLIDYGFTYRRDNNFAQDDVHWWLMSK